MARPVSRAEEERAREHFRALLPHDGICPRCASGKIWRLADGRWRCGDCHYTFHDFTGRFINRGNVRFAVWRELIDSFARCTPCRKAARTTGLSYKTTHKAMHTIRMAIAAGSADPGGLFDEAGEPMAFCSGVKPRRDGEHCLVCRSPVMAVYEDDEGGEADVRLAVVAGLMAREVLGYPIKRNLWRSFIYTGPLRGATGLIFSCCSFVRGAGSVHGRLDPVLMDKDSAFWPYAQELLEDYGTISPQCHPLYLKEAEFRFNHRRDPRLAPLLERLLLRFVPIRTHRRIERQPHGVCLPSG